MKLNQRTKGVLCILSAALFFAGMNTFVRLAGDLPVFEKAFFRNFIAAIMSVILIRKQHVPLYLGKGNVKYVVLRAAFGTLGLLFNFYAVDHLALADANMLNKLSPFFAIIFSYFLLKERVKPVQAVAVIGAFIGALCIIRPTGQNLQTLPAVLGFFSGMFAGAAYTCLRKATSNGAQGPVVVLFFSCFSCIAVLPFIAMDFVMPTARQLVMLLLCGVCGAGGQFSITAAYTFAPAKEISIYDYSQVIFSAVIGYFLFSQLPDALSFVGYALIISMAVLNFVYHNRFEKDGA